MRTDRRTSGGDERRARAAAVAAVILGLLAAGGCARVPAELEGSWRAAGAHGDHTWYKTITLEGREYSMEGDPPITATATIARVEELGARAWNLTLTDRVFHGDDADDEVLEIRLAEDGDSFELEGEQFRKLGER